MLLSLAALFLFPPTLVITIPMWIINALKPRKR